MPYWYNVKTHAVESDEERSASQDVLGPFATIELAQSALTSAHHRNDDADRADAEWSNENDD